MTYAESHPVFARWTLRASVQVRAYAGLMYTSVWACLLCVLVVTFQVCVCTGFSLCNTEWDAVNLSLVVWLCLCERGWEKGKKERERVEDSCICKGMCMSMYTRSRKYDNINMHTCVCVRISLCAVWFLYVMYGGIRCENLFFMFAFNIRQEPIYYNHRYQRYQMAISKGI